MTSPLDEVVEAVDASEHGGGERGALDTCSYVSVLARNSRYSDESEDALWFSIAIKMFSSAKRFFCSIVCVSPRKNAKMLSTGKLGNALLADFLLKLLELELGLEPRMSGFMAACSNLNSAKLRRMR